MRGVRIGPGVQAASVAAGPLFVISMACADAVSRPGTNYGWREVGGLAFLLPFVVLFGAALAAVPVATGAALLGSLGRSNVALQLPVIWALVGAGAGATVGVAVAGAGAGQLMAVVGAMCALICRWRTRWDD